MRQLDQRNLKALVKAAIDNQPFNRAYIEYEKTCPYCEKRLVMARWPIYMCACSEWMANFGGAY
jgi:hypothetical protein